MATYYVSAQTGNDSDDGSSVANAFATLQAGIDAIGAAGDMVYVAPGTYREIITFSSAVNGGSGDHIKVIGDPDCEIFAGETKGVIRVTGLNDDDYVTDASNGNGTIYVNKQWVELHNLHVDGGGHTFESALTTQRTAYGIRTQYDGRCNAFNCIVQATGYGFYRCNTFNCITFVGYYGTYQGLKHVHTITMGGYAGYAFGDCYVDCIGIGQNVAAFWNCDKIINCAAMFCGTGIRTNTGDIALDCYINGCTTALMNQGTQGGDINSGSYVANAFNAAYKTGLHGTMLGPGTRRLQSTTTNYPISTGFTLGDGNTRQGRAVLYSYNQLWEMTRILKPDLLNTELRGKSDADNDSDRDNMYTSYIPTQGVVDTDILGHPRAMGTSTASLHTLDSKLSNRDIGPWEFSSVDHTASYNTAGPGIKITGEGVQSFDVPVQSGSALNISVATKWVSAHDTQKPGVVLKYKAGYPSSSLMVGDTGQNYFTGSSLIETSSYITAAANTWETISFTHDADDKDQIYDLQLRAGNSGSDNYVVFSDLEIS